MTVLRKSWRKVGAGAMAQTSNGMRGHSLNLGALVSPARNTILRRYKLQLTSQVPKEGVVLGRIGNGVVIKQTAQFVFGTI